MARVTAISLRDAAREAMIAAGGRGFVRFLPPGGALLATDANRRCRDESDKAALCAALACVGFVCAEQDGLLALTPADCMLGEIAYDGDRPMDWDSELHQAAALGLRWMSKEKRPLTDAGRQLILEALRMSSQRQPSTGVDALRTRGAVMQRTGDISGMHEAGAILLDWCSRSEGGIIDEA